MSPEMINIVGGLLIAVVSAALTFLFTLLLNKRKVLEYNVFSMPLLRFTPKNERPLTVTVDRVLLTGKEEDRGIKIPVSNAYGFQIHIRNIGNDDVTNVSLTVKLDEAAKVIECETIPVSQAGYEVKVEGNPEVLNTRRIVIPYINRRETFLVRLISTGNENQNCHISFRGLGVRSRRYSPFRTVGQALLAMLLPIVFWVGTKLAFPNLFISLGATRETVTETREVLHTPLWLSLAVMAITLLPGLLFFLFRFPNFLHRTGDQGAERNDAVHEWDLFD